MSRASSIVMLLLLTVASAAHGAEDGFTDTFDVPKDRFATTGKNPFVVLEPGHQMTFEGTANGKDARLVITVLNETKTVDGVETRVVEERESEAGEVVEVSRNFFAIDKHTGDVYYFGEEVDDYKDGKIISHDGAWLSGKDGARYGLFMPGEPKVGQRHYQEIAPKAAMDRAEVQSLDLTVDVPAGRFRKCLKVEETSPLEPDAKEHKLYARGVGLLIDGKLKLTKHGKVAARKPSTQDASAKREADARKRDEKPIWREALAHVGADPLAETIWIESINDPSISAHDRSDLIEDLNEEGFADPRRPTADDLPLIENRLALIEQLAPVAMDAVNADAFAEAYKDLINMYERVVGE